MLLQRCALAAGVRLRACRGAARRGSTRSGWRPASRCVAVADGSPQADASLASSALPRVPRVRTRLHINPLSPELLKPLPPPDWAAMLRDPALPLHVDLGCAYGEFVQALAERDADCNFVGVDLRERVLARATALRAPNVAFVFGNARADDFVQWLLAHYPGELRVVSCLFPDPWTQARFVRRRLLQPELVAAVAARLAPGGVFVTATDNAELAAEMRQPFLADLATWEPSNDAAAADGWAGESPFPVATQWECTCRGRASRMYWARFVRRRA
jgi:tRNA (guanine-N7-)-methyltransferase